MRFTYILLIGFVVLGTYAFLAVIKPVKLSEAIRIEIPYGTSVDKSGDILLESGIIESKETYILLSKIFYPEGITAGRYSFSGNVFVLEVLQRIANGRFGENQIRLTIPEGFTIEKIIARIENNFPNVDKTVLANLLSDKEGYIFPETIFFDRDSTAEEIVSTLISQSNIKISEIIKPIEINSSEANKILIMASLVESEGRTKEERRMIATIINNRLAIDMPLQLDATLTYITGRGSSELTLNDLKINSPYNTYIYRGLPPTPISSPGEESIRAVMDPLPNNYLFYLHDNKGNIYYAKTHTEHVANKNKYLR